MQRKVSQENALEFLRGIVSLRLSPAQQILANVVLADPWFSRAPGSSKMHHAYQGGLVHHTAEVVEGCVYMMGETPNVDSEALLMAAIWHDYMKTSEYILHEDGTITKTPYYYNIGHIAGGAIAFREAAGSFYRGVYKWVEFTDAVTHMILSHHGRLEWRSPVEPQTPEAWILHACDMLSARTIGGK